MLRRGPSGNGIKRLANSVCKKTARVLGKVSRSLNPCLGCCRHHDHPLMSPTPANSPTSLAQPSLVRKTGSFTRVSLSMNTQKDA